MGEAERVGWNIGRQLMVKCRPGEAPRILDFGTRRDVWRTIAVSFGQSFYSVPLLLLNQNKNTNLLNARRSF